MTRKTLYCLSTALVGSVLIAQSALAQETGQGTDDVGLEAIIVTAQKRAENLQEVPAAISAISAGDLQAKGILETSDLMGSLPNLQVTSAYGTTQPNFSIRGVSVANEFSASTASPVGVYVDEVYQSFRASHGQQLYDLERVEVLRGPQGTLYGRNTTGGAINFITRKPDLDGNTGNFTFGYGNYNTWKASGALEATLVPDKFGVRVAATRAKGDGYTFNPTLNQDYGTTDSIAARLTTLFKPSEGLTITLKGYYAKNDPRQDLPYGIGYLQGRSDAGGYSRFVPRPELGGRLLEQNEVQADTAGDYFTSSRGGSLTIEFEASDALTFTSITGYDHGRYKLSPFDCDGSPNNVCAIRYFSESKNFNQDFRVTYDGDRLKLIGGLYYGRDKIATENEPDFFGFLRPLLRGAGVPGGFGNIPIAVGNALRTVPAFAVNPALIPANPNTPLPAGACAPIVVNPNGIFDARSLIAFNSDVAQRNVAGPGRFQIGCAADGAPPFGPILANQKYDIVRPSWALYGEANYAITDQFSITVGLRYTWDKVKYENARTVLFALDGVTPIASLVPYSTTNVGLNGPTVNAQEKTGEFTGRVVLDYKFTDDIMAYASYSRGYRAGAYNGLAYQDISQVYFVPPEKVNAYEAGIKSRFLDNRVQLNLAGFYYDYTGQQIAQIIGATSFLRSADGRIFGAEAELAAQITDRIRIDASLGLLDSKYKGNTVAAPNAPASPQLTLNVNGNPFPNAPSVTFAAGIDFTVWEQDDRKITARADTQYMGKYYFDPFKDYGQNPCDRPAGPVLLATPELACGNPSYWLFNGRITYETDRYAVSLWGRNIFNKFYYTYGLNLNAFYQDYLTRGAPRTWGGEVSIKF
jgi:iron complex outermembrane recepter protein